MSFCVASYFTCSPSASSVSATSASSPIECAPLCCHAVSPLSTQFHRQSNRSPRPHQPPPYGVVPSAVDRWSLSSDSRQHNSNFVLHRSCPPLHEPTRPYTALSARFKASRRSVSRFHPTLFFLSPSRLTSPIDSS